MCTRYNDLYVLKYYKNYRNFKLFCKQYDGHKIVHVLNDKATFSHQYQRALKLGCVIIEKVLLGIMKHCKIDVKCRILFFSRFLHLLKINGWFLSSRGVNFNIDIRKINISNHIEYYYHVFFLRVIRI